MSVGRGVGVSVSVGMGVNVSVLGMLVDFETGWRVGEAGACPELHASVANMSDVRNGINLFFIP